jgi:hypothetical protein
MLNKKDAFLFYESVFGAVQLCYPACRLFFVFGPLLFVPVICTGVGIERMMRIVGILVPAPVIAIAPCDVHSTG